MEVRETALPEVKLIAPKFFGDDRGFFQETYRADAYAAAGMPTTFVQDNWSRSRRGVLRGLHYQLPRPQSKLVCCLRGEIWDVAVDIRRGSPNFGKWTGHVLSDENHHQLFVPAGFAHGFVVLSEIADVLYKCDDLYHPAGDRGVLWSDPELAIEWPLTDVALSPKDTRHLGLSAIAAENLPTYPGTMA